ncbi:13555_t:CDS:2 [Cetraspora pellucida]|uniref:13555_t:CDS:1 n=1 Tax=Cetraspora pellucida TaxID=1433469 RepID=A0A9N9D855_9GLOM|nr:13555_t:CDS:2 [Cetraspora pellucida]
MNKGTNNIELTQITHPKTNQEHETTLRVNSKKSLNWSEDMELEFLVKDNLIDITS